jgi:hypothetical protein
MSEILFQFGVADLEMMSIRRCDVMKTDTDLFHTDVGHVWYFLFDTVDHGSSRFVVRYIDVEISLPRADHCQYLRLVNLESVDVIQNRSPTSPFFPFLDVKMEIMIGSVGLLEDTKFMCSANHLVFSFSTFSAYGHHLH